MLAGVAGAFVYHGIATDHEFQQLIAAGDQATAAGRHSVAIEAYSGALALNPDSMAVYLKRGETYFSQDDPQTARRDLQIAAQLDATATRPHERLGDVSIALGSYEDAAEHYRNFVRLDDRNPHVLYKLALALQHDGRLARAVRLLRRALALDGSFVEARYLLGLCLRVQGRIEEAQVALERVVELAPSFLPARESLAAIYREQRQQREEWQQLDALAALDGTNPGRHVTRARAYARGGRTALATLILEEAAKEYPDRPDISAALGQVRLQIAEARGDPTAFASTLEALQAIPRNLASSDDLARLGQALQLSGNTAEARRVLSLAVTRFPVAPAAFMRLASLEAADGNEPAARRLREQHRLLTERPAATN